ncbi:MAG: acetyl-CoA carboxylase biotin carboxylase subunit [Christensenellales bacterium]|jgi:acetyl-CoA carboxylase biotin carboxylase subunit
MKTVLVANRGEIAVRIIRTCKKLGLRTVAVYSENDEGSMHVRLADESVCIGPRQAEKSYLNIESILAAACAFGAELIHPGVGFLSESEQFSLACAEEGIIFIGPSVSAMSLLGDKRRAREIMEENGFPVVPGVAAPLSGVKEAAVAAKGIGFPLILKACKGGGGKGIRVVHSMGELEKEFPTVSREAELAFGDGSIYIEAYLEAARHIEVQILADEHGNTLHLGTRECSIQRKNQKLIEEAPAANIDGEILRKIETTAVEIARCVGYTNAGTVEFLLTPDNKFYFMEMNARIQVEHPVSESIYGIDLIKAQIQVALKHTINIEQKDLVQRGHAIECRVNAEDTNAGFRPSPGKITAMSLPGGYGVRVDTGYEAGDEISPYYDSMIMKVICHGDDREEALSLARAALKELKVEGVSHSAAFIRAVLEDGEFTSGKAHTKWIEKTFYNRYMREKV